MNLQEQICEAVKVVAQQEISKVSFDKTIIGTIIDASTADEGYYWVKSENLKFKAYNDGEKRYYNNNEVQILVPNNDYSNKKIIIGLNAPNSENIVAPFLTAKNNIIKMRTLVEVNQAQEMPEAVNTIIEAGVYNALVISASFKTNNSGNDTIDPYGLMVTFTTSDNKSIVYKLDSHKHMSGSINNFIVPFYQEVIYNDFGTLPQITKVEYSAYGTQVDIYKINIYLGCDTSQIASDKELRIYTNDTLTYGDGQKVKQISSLWIDKAENITSALPIWYRWSHAQQGWVMYSTKASLSITPTLDSAQSGERFKAVYSINGVDYVSNILTITNVSGSMTALLFDEANALRINFGYGASESFAIYGPDYHLNSLIEGSKKRELYVTYEPEFEENKLTEDDWRQCRVKWTIPNRSTMLKPHDDNQGFTINENSFTTEYIKQATYDSDRKFYFAIKSPYLPLNTNNTIKCSLTLPSGRTVHTEKTFIFAQQGTSGTDYTLVVKQSNDKSYVYKDQSVRLEAFLYDKNNVKCTMSGVSWKPLLIENADPISGEYIDIQEVKNCELYEVSTIYNGINFKTYFPLIVSTWEKVNPDMPYMFYYDTLGNLKGQSTHKLAIAPVNMTNFTLEFYSDGKRWENQTIEQHKRFLPRLSGAELIAPSTINTSLNLIAVLTCTNNSNFVWRQPIPFLQTVYDSPLLNNWDGAKFEDDNVILSAMMGAGYKDYENTFTGVLMGDIGSGASIAYSGLLGFNQGRASFGFNTNGSAFIGTSGSGQIQFNPIGGNNDSVIIQSGNFGEEDGVKTGTRLSLSDGALQMYNKNGDYLVFDNNGLSIKTSKLDLTGNTLGVNMIPGTKAGLLNGWRTGGWGNVDSSLDIAETSSVSSVNGGNGNGYILTVKNFNSKPESKYAGWVAMNYDITDYFDRHSKDGKLVCSFSCKITVPTKTPIGDQIFDSPPGADIRIGFPQCMNPIYIAHPEKWQNKCMVTFKRDENVANGTQTYLTYDSMIIEGEGNGVVDEDKRTVTLQVNGITVQRMTASQTTETTVTEKEKERDMNKVFFSISMWCYQGQGGTNTFQTQITDLKVEEGYYSTPWNPSPSDEIIDIFSLGSQEQGVYLQNGQLSINASYIRTGKVENEGLSIDFTNGEIAAKKNFCLSGPCYTDSSDGSTYVIGDTKLTNEELSFRPRVGEQKRLEAVIGYNVLDIKSRDFAIEPITESNPKTEYITKGHYCEITRNSSSGSLNVRYQNGEKTGMTVPAGGKIYALCDSGGTPMTVRLPSPSSDYYKCFLTTPTSGDLNNYYLVSKWLNKKAAFNSPGIEQKITEEIVTYNDTKSVRVQGFRIYYNPDTKHATLAAGDGDNSFLYDTEYGTSVYGSKKLWT